MKKAQLEGMETIIISIILMIVIIIGVSFYVKGTKISNQEEITKNQLDNLKSLSIKLTYLPELSCPDFGASKTSPCIDKYKAEAFGAMLESDNELRITYHDLFGDSEIRIEQVYPSQNPIVIYDATQNDDGFVSWFPITIYDPITQNRVLGVLTIRN